MAAWESEFTTPDTVARVWLVLDLTVLSQSVSDNESEVAWQARMEERVNGSPNRAYHDCVASVTVGSLVYAASNLDYNFNLTNETIVIAGGVLTIPHTADGTKTISIAASYNGRSPLGTASLAASFTLPPIPRNRVFVGVDDEWVEHELYVGVNDAWIPARPYVGVDDAWKELQPS